MTLISILLALTEAGYSQNINWRSLNENQPNSVQFHVGYDFGITTKIGYSRSFTLIKPVTLSLNYSVPMGNKLMDDFKVNIGGQVEVFEIDGFSAAIKISSIFRRYQTDLVRMLDFGSDFGIVAGYYNPDWYAAGEFGFDKSITANIKHSDIMKTNFPGITDGWYIPLGGNFYYGIQAGKSIGESYDFSLRFGATQAQFHDENSMLPYYLQLGMGMRF